MIIGMAGRGVGVRRLGGHALLLVIAAVGAVACGGGDSPGRADAPPASSPKPAPTIAQDAAGTDRRELRRLGTRYATAFAAADWAGVCETLDPRVQRRFARRAGSCTGLYRQQASELRAARRAARLLQPNSVTLRGDSAIIRMGPSGGSGRDVAAKYYAVRVGDEWRVTLKRYAS